MKNSQASRKYIALLRGINVGGNHKVPMEILSKGLLNLDFTNIVTLLNSGNIIFETTKTKIDELEISITENLEKLFEFPIPVLLREAKDILHISTMNPFKNIEVTKDTRLYVSFLKQKPIVDLTFPWTSEDRSFQILDVKDKTVFSVLDISIANTPKGMETLEKLFGKEITTRNWNTIIKIIDKL